jgi:hypothetical protein
VTTLAENMEQNITMESGGIELDGVRAWNASVIKGDTIVYNTDSFKTGESASLKMCLKLPGFEVMADGQVQVEGSKTICKWQALMEGDVRLKKTSFGCGW